MKILRGAALLLVFLPLSFAESKVLGILSQELDRNFSILKEKADPPPYFISYEVTEEESHHIGATLGALTTDSEGTSRYLDVSLRSGEPKLDNYHRVRGERAHFTSGARVSIEDDPAAIKQQVWIETDRAYRAAAERLIKIRSNEQMRVAAEDPSDDFSIEPPSVHSEPAAALHLDAGLWTDRVRKLSLVFQGYPEILVSGVTLSTQRETKYFVSTEGSRLEHGRSFVRISISAEGRAEDGMNLSTFESFDAADPSGLPADDVLLAAADRVAKDLTALLHAPVVDPYLGPAIFSGRAAGVFFHEIFGHRIEGHRQKDESEGQTFTKSLGKSVLPDFLSVVFDPTLHKFQGTDLNGWFSYDDEGIAGQRFTAVDHGILKSFLMSRSPIKGFDHSNGHGRRQPGLEVVSRQSNLLVDSTKTVPEARLREMLIEEVKRQKKPYGLYFKDVTGGFTTTARAGMQAFKVLPVVVYRVYPDGKPDELVRGVDIVGTPLASFAKILATSDHAEVFNGYCGAESGTVPVSAVSPAILVSEIEIEKKEKSQDKPPLLPFPKDADSVK
ncbi:MAG TPA: TldD/PmbA family protein [Bryobacteraceae bacterium]|nr:TldD/PmbA family protein [Bryobacteraceae bacterium]